MKSNRKYFKTIIFVAFISMIFSIVSPSFNAFAYTTNNGALLINAKFEDGPIVRDDMVKELLIDYKILDLKKLSSGDKLVIQLPSIFSKIKPNYRKEHFSNYEINGNTLTFTFNDNAADSGVQGTLDLILETSRDSNVRKQTYPIYINAPGNSKVLYLNGEPSSHENPQTTGISPIMYKRNGLKFDGNRIGVILDGTQIPYYVEINRLSVKDESPINTPLMATKFVDNIPEGMELNINSVSIVKRTCLGYYGQGNAKYETKDVTKDLLKDNSLTVTSKQISLNLYNIGAYDNYGIYYKTFVTKNKKLYKNTAKFSYYNTNTGKPDSVTSESDARLTSTSTALNVHKKVDQEKINNNPNNQKIKYTIYFDPAGTFDSNVVRISDKFDSRLTDIKIYNVTKQFTTEIKDEFDEKSKKTVKVLYARNDKGIINEQNPAYIVIEASMKNVKPGETIFNTAKVNEIDTNTVHTKKSPEVKILKIDKNDTSKTPTCIGGAIFKLTSKDGKPVKDIYKKNQSIITSLSNKELTIELPYGDYTLTEIKPPEGYKLDQPPINFTVNDDTETLQIIAKDSMLPSTCNLNINKVNENGTPLLGAEFNLFKASDLNHPLKFTNLNSKNIYQLNNSGFSSMSPIGSDASLSINKLPYGNYVLKESKAPNGYLLSDDIYITINSKESFYTIGNNGKKVSLNKDSKTSSYTISVKDKPRIILPETGGNGPFRFYLIGTTSLVSVLILLSTNKLILRKKEN